MGPKENRAKINYYTHQRTMNALVRTYVRIQADEGIQTNYAFWFGLKIETK